MRWTIPVDRYEGGHKNYISERVSRCSGSFLFIIKSQQLWRVGNENNKTQDVRNEPEKTINYYRKVVNESMSVTKTNEPH